MGKESTIEKAVKKYAREKGCYVRKFKSPSQRGVPDCLFLSPYGKVFFIEFKSPGKEPTDLQEREMKEINNRKGHAHWTDSVMIGKKIVNFYL